MMRNHQQKFLRNVIGGMGALMLLSATNAFAFPSSGTCGFLITNPVPYGQALPATGTYNTLGTLTFTDATKGTLKAISIGSSFGTAGPAVSDADTQAITTAIDFTITDSAISGIKIMTFTGGDAAAPTTHKINLYATNGDKTILMQGATLLHSGVCQF